MPSERELIRETFSPTQEEAILAFRKATRELDEEPFTILHHLHYAGESKRQVADQLDVDVSTLEEREKDIVNELSKKLEEEGIDRDARALLELDAREWRKGGDFIHSLAAVDRLRERPPAVQVAAITELQNMGEEAATPQVIEALEERMESEYTNVKNCAKRALNVLKPLLESQEEESEEEENEDIWSLLSLDAFESVASPRKATLDQEGESEVQEKGGWEKQIDLTQLPRFSSSDLLDRLAWTGLKLRVGRRTAGEGQAFYNVEAEGDEDGPDVSEDSPQAALGVSLRELEGEREERAILQPGEQEAAFSLILPADWKKVAIKLSIEPVQADESS